MTTPLPATTPPGENPIRIKVIRKKHGKQPPPFLFRNRYLFIWDMACEEYDWAVVYDEMPNRDEGTFRDGKEPLRCPPEHTILLTVEPISIKDYGIAYPRQFGCVLTSQPLSLFPGCHAVLGEGYYKWFYGKGWQEVVSQSEPPEKTSVLSVVCSAKQQRHTAHRRRFELIRGLSQRIPELVWYGHGIQPIAHKYDALDAFRYHIAIENHLAPHHWTEKIIDPLLAWTLPFYVGDPELESVLPPESFIRIPMDDIPEAERIIRSAIQNQEWEKRLPAIRQACELLLTRYNTWAQIARVIEDGDVGAPRNHGFLRSRHALRRNPFVAIQDGWRHFKRAFGG